MSMKMAFELYYFQAILNRLGCFRNSAYTEFRMFVKFRIFRIVYGIALNYAEFRITEFVEYRGISRNSATFGVTEFRITLFF